MDLPQQSWSRIPWRPSRRSTGCEAGRGESRWGHRTLPLSWPWRRRRWPRNTERWWWSRTPGGRRRLRRGHCIAGLCRTVYQELGENKRRKLNAGKNFLELEKLWKRERLQNHRCWFSLSSELWMWEFNCSPLSQSKWLLSSLYYSFDKWSVCKRSTAHCTDHRRWVASPNSCS